MEQQCLCRWLRDVERRWLVLTGETVSLSSCPALAERALSDFPLFLDDDLASRLLGEEARCEQRWRDVAPVFSSPCQERAREDATDDEDTSPSLLPAELWTAVTTFLSLSSALALSATSRTLRSFLFSFLSSSAAAARYPERWARRVREPNKQEKLVAPCWSAGGNCVISHDSDFAETESGVAFIQRSAIEERALLFGEISPPKKFAENVGSIARGAGGVIAVVGNELQLLHSSSSSFFSSSLRVPACGKLVAANVDFAVNVGAEGAAVRACPNFGQIRTVDFFGIENAFSATVFRNLCAVGAGPDCVLFNCESGRVLHGQKKKISPKSAELQMTEEEERPAIASEKYVAAPEPEVPEAPEAPGLEVASSVGLSESTLFFLSFVVNCDLESSQMLTVDHETQTRTVLSLGKKKLVGMRFSPKFELLTVDSSGVAALWDLRARYNLRPALQMFGGIGRKNLRFSTVDS
jgi:hypothetical protein